MNKRGMSDLVKWFVVFGIFLMIVITLTPTDFFIDFASTVDLTVDTSTTSFSEAWNANLFFLDYFFGGLSSWLIQDVGEASAIIITISLFLLLFVTFGDIITTFSTFEKGTSWFVAFLLAVILANLKALVSILAFFVGIFSFLGGLAVIVGITASFVAFFVVNAGIGRLGPWIMNRKALAYAQKSKIESAQGAADVASAVQSLKTAGAAFKKGSSSP